MQLRARVDGVVADAGGLQPELEVMPEMLRLRRLESGVAPGMRDHSCVSRAESRRRGKEGIERGRKRREEMGGDIGRGPRGDSTNGKAKKDDQWSGHLLPFHPSVYN
jgi:hypothetical protein